jgi:hypothetical protein
MRGVAGGQLFVVMGDHSDAVLVRISDDALQISIALRGVVVAMLSSGGGCHVGCGRAQKLRHAQKHHRARYGMESTVSMTHESILLLSAVGKARDRDQGIPSPTKQIFPPYAFI